MWKGFLDPHGFLVVLEGHLSLHLEETLHLLIEIMSSDQTFDEETLLGITPVRHLAVEAMAYPHLVMTVLA
jgi:hypothetical protein